MYNIWYDIAICYSTFTKLYAMATARRWFQYSSSTTSHQPETEMLWIVLFSFKAFIKYLAPSGPIQFPRLFTEGGGADSDEMWGKLWLSSWMGDWWSEIKIYSFCD